MPVDDILLEAQDKMEKALEVLINELKGIRTGRATPGLVENVRVEYYGSPTPLKAIAGISAPDPRLLIIKPFDPSSLSDIEKAIQKSDLGLNPSSDGKMLRLAVPPLSEERRKQLGKQGKEMGEKAKVAIRNLRRDAIKMSEDEEKKGTISEDDKFRVKEEIQKLLDEHEKKAGEILEKKTKEIMEI